MDIYQFRLLAIIVVGLIGAILTFARRYNNKSDNAGIGIAGWSMFIILCLALGKF